MSEANQNEGGEFVRQDVVPGWVDLVRQQVASLRFGTVLITVHESRVVQVEKSEKLRLDQWPSTPSKPSSRG